MSKKIEFVIPDEMLEKFDSWARDKGFQSRSEALRDLLRRVLFKE